MLTVLRRTRKAHILTHSIGLISRTQPGPDSSEQTITSRRCIRPPQPCWQQEYNIIM